MSPPETEGIPAIESRPGELLRGGGPFMEWGWLTGTGRGPLGFPPTGPVKRGWKDLWGKAGAMFEVGTAMTPGRVSSGRAVCNRGGGGTIEL